MSTPQKPIKKKGVTVQLLIRQCPDVEDLTVRFIGVSGSGKSTLLNELTDSLVEKYDSNKFRNRCSIDYAFDGQIRRR